jgi:hypothetical protein
MELHEGHWYRQARWGMTSRPNLHRREAIVLGIIEAFGAAHVNTCI